RPFETIEPQRLLLPGNRPRDLPASRDAAVDGLTIFTTGLRGLEGGVTTGLTSLPKCGTAPAWPRPLEPPAVRGRRAHEPLPMDRRLRALRLRLLRARLRATLTAWS